MCLKHYKDQGKVIFLQGCRPTDCWTNKKAAHACSNKYICSDNIHKLTAYSLSQHNHLNI